LHIDRADLVIIWGSNPVEGHPRHFERYSVLPHGQFIPRGRTGRFVIVADVRRTASTEAADLCLPIEPDRDFEALWTLRGLVRGLPVEPTAVTGARCGSPPPSTASTDPARPPAWMKSLSRSAVSCPPTTQATATCCECWMNNSAHITRIALRTAAQRSLRWPSTKS
jgi:hypothetical protein